MSDSDSREERRGKMKERRGGLKDKIKPALIILAILLIIYGIWYSYDKFFSYRSIALWGEVTSIEHIE